MVFSTSAFAVFADTAADQEGEQLAKDTPAAEELVNETPEEPAAVTEQAEDVQEQGTEATENGGVTEAEDSAKLTGYTEWYSIGGDTYDATEEKPDGDKWSYVAKTNTLTLNNYTAGGFIDFGGTDLNVVLEGNNTIRGIGEDGISHKLVISGNGSLTCQNGYGLAAGEVVIKGGSINIKNCGNGIFAHQMISFSGDIHVDVETNGMAPSEKKKNYSPAVVCYKEDGIKLSDDVQIVLPENAKFAPYDGDYGLSESVTVNKVKGTMIADASGNPAEHVIIEKVAKDRNPSGLLLSKAVAKGKTNMELSWTAMNDVDGYDVFFAPCNSKGKKYEPALVASVDKATTSYTVSSLKKGTPYKAYVQAYIMKQGSKQYVGTSLLTHAFAGGSSKKFTNPKSVKVKKAKVSVKKGKTYKIRASVRKVKKSKKLIRIGHAPKLRYLSSNTSIATVSKKGKIKGVAPGTCTVYAIAANGVYKAVNVTVK
jgi:hypothetical protein